MIFSIISIFVDLLSVMHLSLYTIVGIVILVIIVITRCLCKLNDPILVYIT